METLSILKALCVGNLQVISYPPPHTHTHTHTQKSVMQSFGVRFDLHLNNQVSK